MTSLSEMKEELTSTLHARQNPFMAPSEIGLPKSGTLTFSEDVHLSEYLYNVFSTGQADEIVPRYTATFTDIPGHREHVKASETFGYNIQKALIAQREPNFQTVIKQAAYETMVFHAQQQGLFALDKSGPLNDIATKIGFSDFASAETLLMETPAAPPSVTELVTDMFNKNFSAGNRAAHGRRAYAMSVEERLADRVRRENQQTLMIKANNDQVRDNPYLTGLQIEKHLPVKAPHQIPTF